VFVGEELDFDVLWLFDVMFAVDVVVVECGYGFVVRGFD